ncbi:alkaline phosphatase [Marinomonas transparens]|uniref:Alkaline phosphatase n=1 Tax=Marinomonas transparens TaxID=2795388 RepID=A0A934N3T9_9GAMM|nr:alkaline phosphatase [Marinomonas transparens]MBJ7539363.1 alkaline phosphatase [Marinomonas transparens]
MKINLVTKSVAAVATAGVMSSVMASGVTQSNDQWFKDGQATLQQKLNAPRINGMAKNVILFVGDGNGVTSNTAIRMYKGQKEGGSGEEYVLSYEQFPHLALAKTYNTNAQTPDSAGTATAFLTGVKTKAGMLSVASNVDRGDCQAGMKNEVTTILELAEQAGKSTGVVSTARITHATPAAAYAHSADRNYEDDSKLSAEQKAAGCIDIASQAVDSNVDVLFGGGRRHFIPKTMKDGEGKSGKRTDGRNLTKEWTKKYQNASYIWNQAGFDKLNTEKTGPVLGLFNSSHMEYEADRAKDKGGEPSLAEMTGKAIDILDNNKKGYFLLVEGGRIDHAHHAGNAARALEDGSAFADAVQAAMEKTYQEDTLIIVTADHSHTLTMQGYAKRGNPILGLSVGVDGKGHPKTTPNLDDDGKPFTTLSYINGPGAVKGEREDLTNVDTTDIDYIQQALFPKSSESHAGEDVAIYARGPKAWLMDGSVEQNYIFNVMGYASGLVK